MSQLVQRMTGAALQSKESFEDLVLSRELLPLGFRMLALDVELRYGL
jgi:hypothetical protein